MPSHPNRAFPSATFLKGTNFDCMEWVYWVQLALWWSLFENMSGSVRSGDVLSALLFLLTGSNITVGVVQVSSSCL